MQRSATWIVGGMNARSFLLLACCALAPGLACTAPRAPVAAPAAMASPTVSEAELAALRDYLPSGRASAPPTPALVDAALRCLRSSDGAVRDGVGYEVLARWLGKERLLDDATTDALRARLVAQLGDGLSLAGAAGVQISTAAAPAGAAGAPASASGSGSGTAPDGVPASAPTSTSTAQAAQTASTNAQTGAHAAQTSAPTHASTNAQTTAQTGAQTDEPSDAVFGRSFAALALSLVAARELAAPRWTAAELAEQLAAAQTYAARERDLRGYVPGKGWAHAVAHTADWMKMLGRHPLLSPAQAEALAHALVELAVRRHGVRLAHGEEDRLAAALRSLIDRGALPEAVLDKLLARLLEPVRAGWPSPFDPTLYAAQRNALALFYTLFTSLSLSDTPAAAAALARLRLAAES